MGKRAEWREVDQYGPVRLMAAADGYAMVRRRGCIPFVIGLTTWELAPTSQPAPTQDDAR